MTASSRHAETASDFAARQYAQLIEAGMESAAARKRLAQVLGEDALRALDAQVSAGQAARDDALVRRARELGGDGCAAQAAFAAARRDMHLFALDWWRPTRSFLLYALVLLVMASLLVALFMTLVLPAFASMDRITGVGNGGAAGMIMALGGIRLWLPLLCFALLLVVFAAAMLAMRRAASALRPLPGGAARVLLRKPGARAYALVRALEQAHALHRAGVPAARMGEVLEHIHKDVPRHDAAGEVARVHQCLLHAAELGTFDAELDWQRRIARSHMLARWELSRDRLILAARIVFYLIVGYLVATLYTPIFTVAMHMGIKP